MILLYLLFGLLAGAYANILIDRLPLYITEKIELVFSLTDRKCSNCKKNKSIISLISIIYFSIYKGRCQYCKKKISYRYLIIELIFIVLSIILFTQNDFNITILYKLFFLYIIVMLLVIDFKTKLLPDILTIVLLWTGLLININGVYVSIHDAIYGAIAGYLLLWILYWAFKFLAKKEGLGYGDFKYMAAMGAWFGWSSLTDIIIISSILGVIYFIINTKKDTDEIAFGPFISIAGLIIFLYPNILRF